MVSSDHPESESTMLRKWARRCERCCCLSATYFPLVFVYSITTWAVWVEASMGFGPTKSRWIGSGTSLLGISLYVLLNWSYTTAVFIDPGSPIASNNGYSSLPTHAPPSATSFTVKSSGELRYCKKCQSRKPDRAHHCSSCKRCVLKMDHHCPWLATCVGLRNYKPFLLFLIYTTLFCFVCFGVSGNWVWNEILKDGQYEDTFMPINYVMLAVISAIIGVVLAAFTGWHLALACRNQTTIECLEKTRYLSPLRKAMQHQHITQHRGQGNGLASYGQQLLDIHANTIPGVTRPEEGEVDLAAVNADNQGAHMSYDAMERLRARQRYEEYLDEQDSEKLPNAFDLGWRKNLFHLFGPRPLLWGLPICNSSWDGWTWEPSEKWLAARDQVRVEREEQHRRERAAGWGEESHYYGGQAPNNTQAQGAGRHYLTSPSPSPASGQRSPSKADRVLGRDPSQFADADFTPHDALSLRDLKSQDENDYDTSSDEHDVHVDGAAGSWGVQRMTGGGASRLLGKGQAPKNSDWRRDASNDDGVD